MSDSSAISKFSLNIWKFSVHRLLKPSLENLSINLLASEMNAIVWYFEHSLALPFLWIGMNTVTFSRIVAANEFSKFAGILSAALSQHHLLGFKIAQLEFHYFHFVRSDAS